MSFGRSGFGSGENRRRRSLGASLGGASKPSQNLIPNAWLDLNFVEGVYKLAGADTTPLAALDFSNGESRTVTDAAGGDHVFLQNAMPITDAGFWVNAGSTFNNRDLASLKDVLGSQVFSALGAGGITVFMEWVMSTFDSSDHWPLTFFNSAETAFLNIASNNSFVGSFSGSMTSGDWGVGPIGTSQNAAGRVLRVAMRIKNSDFSFAESVGDLGILQAASPTLADFTGGKIWLGSHKYDLFINNPIRRFALALTPRPDAELTAFVQGTAAPTFANLAFSNQISGAAASALPVLGVNTHIPRKNAVDIPAANNLAMAQAIGANAIRLDIGWQTIEPSAASYTFSYYDGTMNAFHGASIPVLMMFGYGNTAYTGSSANPPSDATGRTGMTNAAVALVSHYSWASLEVLNEQNLDVFTGSNPDATRCATTLMAVAAGVKGAQPGMKVISAGISSASWNAPATWATTFFGAMTTKTNVDGWAFHPYVDTSSVNSVPEFAVTMDNAMFVILTGKEKHNTESGYPIQWTGSDQNLQAKYVIRGYMSSVRAGLKSHYHYDLADDGPDKTDSEQTYGLHDENFVIKPSGLAYKRLSDLKAAAVTYDVDAVPGFDLTAVTIHKASGKTLLLAAERMATSFIRDVGSFTTVSATDALGNPITVTRLSGNVVKVPVNPTNCPIILNVA